MKLSKDTVYELSWHDIKVLDAINEKKNQTSIDIANKKITSKTQTYRSIEKLKSVGFLTDVKIDYQRANELVPKIKIDFNITKIN